MVETEEYVLENVSEAVSDRVGLIMPEGYNLELSANEVNFSARVQKAVGKEIASVPVKIVNLARGRKVEVQPESISVVVFGGEDVVNQLTRDQIEVTVNCGTIKRNQEAKLQPQVELPPEVSLIRTDPDSLVVNVR